MPETRPTPTPTQRIALWILNTLLFFVVALYPSYQMATFAPDSTVHYTFYTLVVLVLGLYALASALLFKRT